MLTSRIVAALAWLVVPAGALAQDPSDGGAVESLFSCRSIEDPQARLACQDDRLAELSQALDSGRVVLVERDAIRNVERESFGLSLPSIAGLGAFFGRGDNEARVSAPVQAETETRAEDGSVTVFDDSGSVDEIRGLAVERVTTDRVGKLTVYLENGQVWRQTDTASVSVRRSHLDGLTATISRGALSSYFMTLSHNSRRFRAERLR
ncbi:hypothetical protein ACWCOP_05400 [Maricaulaceae bacterium MS644]